MFALIMSTGSYTVLTHTFYTFYITLYTIHISAKLCNWVSYMIHISAKLCTWLSYTILFNLAL